MRVSIFTGIIAALFSAHSVSALCCTECGDVLTQCIDECVAGGDSRTVCGKICYGQGVSSPNGTHFIRFKQTNLSCLDWLRLRLRRWLLNYDINDMSIFGLYEGVSRCEMGLDL